MAPCNAGVITVEVLEARLPRRISVTKKEKPLNPYAAIVVGHSHVPIRCSDTGCCGFAPSRVLFAPMRDAPKMGALHLPTCLMSSSANGRPSLWCECAGLNTSSPSYAMCSARPS